MRHSITRGFTLVELLIAMTIIGLVVGGTVVLVRQVINTNAYDSGRIMVNNDMMKLTRDMTTDAVFANYFIIYPNYTNRSITSGGVTVDNAMGDGLSGDMVVLVTVMTDPTTTNGTTKVSNLVGYYRDSSSSTVAGPVRKFKQAISPPSTQAVYQLLNTYVPVGSSSANPTVIPLALGEANGSLFYNYFNRSIMLKSQIEEPGNVYQEAQNTYNFTVAPRG